MVKDINSGTNSNRSAASHIKSTASRIEGAASRIESATSHAKSAARGFKFYKFWNVPASWFGERASWQTGRHSETINNSLAHITSIYDHCF